MASHTSIIAPPYHVQTTAAATRSGFPYFLIMILSLPCGIRNGEPLALMVFIPLQTRVCIKPRGFFAC
jgi:hypothetical protein